MMAGPEGEERWEIAEAGGKGSGKGKEGSLCPHRDPYGSIDLLPHWRRHLRLDYPTLLLRGKPMMLKRKEATENKVN